MTREWKPNGSNAEYWRSDNPLIAGWWRFGDAPPKNNYLTEGEQGPTNYLSGLLTDSGPQKHHLLPFLVDEVDEEIMSAVTGIAPWALSGSGIKMNAAAGTENNFLYADPAFAIETDASVTHGSNSPGGISMYSGLTVIGWAQIPDQIPAVSTERLLLGRADQDTTISNLTWRLTWQDLPAATGRFKLRATMQTASATLSPSTTIQTTSIIHTLDPTFDPTRPANPNFPTDRTKPFFFAAQFRRENAESDRSFGPLGNGSVKLFIGTEESGVIATSLNAHRGSNVGARYANADLNNIPLTVFNECRGLRSGNPSTNRHMPSGTILDELIMINDGFLSEDLILHYALSGMSDITTSNPESLDFTSEFPGSSGLAAYWSFDDDTGTNSAPATQGDPRLELSLSGTPSLMSFVDGVNGGRALRLTPTRNSVFNSNNEEALNSTEYPVIPAESGLSLLWPSGQTVDEGMTIIGWSRAVPTGTNLLGGAFGWFGENSAQQSFWTDTYTASSPTFNANVLGVIMQPSGIPTNAPAAPLIRLATKDSQAIGDRMGAALGLSNASTLSDPEYDTSDDGWHLWAGVYDIRAGMVYMVKDAKFVIPMSQQISSASGFSSDNFGPGKAFFGFTPRGTRSWEIDNFAVYNRILSIPEMSGFALNGIQGAPIETDVDVSFKSVVGYWPLTGITNYDPTGVSGYRVDDKSWYSHHLTNLSGQFSFDSAKLNSELTAFATSTQVELSGSMISLERTLHGANLDASTTNLFATSGFSAGAWVYLPSGDLSTEGQGTSGLFGSHMIMGAWGPGS